jgi:hypothetical protein
MDYRDVLSDIFNGKGPSSLRTIFDIDNKEWSDTDIDKKKYMLKNMLKAYPLTYWLEEYKLQYGNTHAHIIEAIDRSLRQLNIVKLIQEAEHDKFVDLVTSRVLNDVELNTELGEEYHYSSVALCVIDSIYSIGVRYGSVENVIKHLVATLKIEAKAVIIDSIRQNEITTTQFLTSIQDWTVEEMATILYDNQQRTSTRNGILKADAVYQFLLILQTYSVETFTDLEKVYNRSDFMNDIKSIRGQASGISLTYFFMLAGYQDLTKFDRMVSEFLKDTLGQEVRMADGQKILIATAERLSEVLGRPISALLLDNNIWKYERKRKLGLL